MPSASQTMPDLQPQQQCRLPASRHAESVTPHPFALYMQEPTPGDQPNQQQGQQQQQQQQGPGGGVGRVAVTGLQLQARLVRPLIQVKISLVLDTTAWRAGPLATPPVSLSPLS